MCNIIIKLIDLYRKTPLHSHSYCRFYPTCSQYMIEAIEEYKLKGIFLGLKRIIRCNPFGKSGYDPLIKKGE